MKPRSVQLSSCTPYRVQRNFEEILSSMVFAQIQTCTSFHGMAHACACVRSRVRVSTHRAVSVAPLAESYLRGDLPRGLPRHWVAPVVQGYVSDMMASTDFASRQLFSKSKRTLAAWGQPCLAEVVASRMIVEGKRMRARVYVRAHVHTCIRASR